MDVVLWGSVVIVILLAAGGCVVWVRSRFLNPANKPGQEAVFSLDSLERLYAQGQLSREEFRRLRYAALGLSSGQPAADEAQAGEPASGEAPPPDTPGDKKPPGELSTPPQDDDGKQ